MWYIYFKTFSKTKRQDIAENVIGIIEKLDLFPDFQHSLCFYTRKKDPLLKSSYKLELKDDNKNVTGFTKEPSQVSWKKLKERKGSININVKEIMRKKEDVCTTKWEKFETKRNNHEEH